MRKKNTEIPKEKKEEIDFSRLNTRSMRVVYWLLQSLMIVTFLFSLVSLFIQKEYRETNIEHMMLCVVAIVLFNIPQIMQRKFNLYIPPAMYIFVLVFIYAHFILGEVRGMYKESMVFDKILHTTSGLAIAIGGFSLVNFLNNSRNSHLKLSPLFVAIFSFCFALAIAVLWEIFEFAADCLVGTNMQQYLPPKNLENVIVDPPQGYGLIDTMGDVIVSTIAAFVVCLIGYFALRKKNKNFNRFLFRKITDYDTAIDEATEAGDERLAESLRRAKAAAEKKAAQDALETLEEPTNADVTTRAEETIDAEVAADAEQTSADTKDEPPKE